MALARRPLLQVLEKRLHAEKSEANSGLPMSMESQRIELRITHDHPKDIPGLASAALLIDKLHQQP